LWRWIVLLETIEKNSIIEVEKRRDKITWSWTIFALFSRLIFFILVGVIFLIILYAIPIALPMQVIIVFWPIQVIIGNIFSFLLLWWLAKREEVRFFDLMNFNREYLKKDLIILIVAFAPIFLVSYFGLNLTALLIYGGAAPEDMFLNIPLWIVIVALIFIPLTNPLVELTTYFAYSFQRIRVLSNKQWLAVLLSGTFLALQHIAFPLILDIRFILWRFVSFIPLGIVMALIYLKIRRFYIFIIGHFILDLQLVIVLLIYTI